MRVVCDNCGAVYKIPESKLVREVNKATCRKCGHGIIIRKTSMGHSDGEPDPADSEATQITSVDELEARARAQQTAAAGKPSAGFGHFGQPEVFGDEVVPPTVVNQPGGQEQTVPRAGRSPAPVSQNAVPLPAQMPPRPQIVPQTTPPPPAMSAMTMGPPAPVSFDPSGDMTLVMMGCFGCLVGSAVLATSEGSVLLGTVGLAICVGSAITSLLVLVTGDRGRKEARVFLSMFLALFFAGGAGGSWYLFSAATGLMEQLAALELPTMPVPEAQVEKDPTGLLKGGDEPSVDAEEDAEGDPLTEIDAEDTAVEDEPVVPSPPKKSYTAKYTGSGGGSNTKSGGGSSTKSGGGSNTTTSSTPPPKKSSPEPPKPTSQGVPVTVLDTMLKSNKGVKTCFGRYRAETGALPSGRITVELTVQPSGRATQARIDGGAYAGTSLDSCLSDAIKAITFPPWDGVEGLTYFYPFILN